MQWNLFWTILQKNKYAFNAHFELIIKMGKHCAVDVNTIWESLLTVDQPTKWGIEIEGEDEIQLEYLNNPKIKLIHYLIASYGSVQQTGIHSWPIQLGHYGQN
jgi:hypothetical protein